jgi:glucose-1-phosphate adenylyltransferase
LVRASTHPTAVFRKKTSTQHQATTDHHFPSLRRFTEPVEFADTDCFHKKPWYSRKSAKHKGLAMKDVLAVILAGGRGARLEPLTRDRAKPAVPFGGSYRIIDFTLSNGLNSGIRKILVLTQYKAMSLDRHINLGWESYLCRELGEFIDVVPPQQRIDEHWYQGTADAVYQNIYTIEKERPTHVVILAGDHIYKMNYAKLVQRHIETNADMTVATLRVPCETAAGQFGVAEIDNENRMLGFAEKPLDPKPIPGDPGYSLASMGIYVFTARFLFEQLCLDATRPGSHHDFGHDMIPAVIQTHRVFAFPFMDENRKQEAYWRDVGTLDAYYDANMDLISVDPQLNMYDSDWPIRTYQPNLPPPKFVFAEAGENARRGEALDSIVCQGCIVSGGQLERSIVGVNSRINSYAQVRDSILFEGVDVGRSAKIRRAIIDKGVNIPPGIEIGYDHDLDRSRGFTVSEKGVTVIAKTHGLEQFSEKGV